MLAADLLVEQPAFPLPVGIGDAFFKVGDNGETQLAGPFQFAAPLGRVQLQPRAFQFLLQSLGAVDGRLLVPPLQCEFVRAFLQVAQFLLQLVEADPRSIVGFLLQGLALDLELDDPPVELVDGFGLGIDLHPEPARGLIDQVDGLVGQKPVRNIAVGQRRRRYQCAVGDADAVVDLVFFFQPPQDRDRVLHIRLADEYRLETPRQRRVLLDMLAVFVERRRPDAVQFTARQRRLEHVGRVHRTLWPCPRRRACAVRR